MRSSARRQGQSRGQGQVHFTVASVAELTGYSVRTLRRHIAAGRLPIVRRKGQVFITAADARVWLGHNLSLWNWKDKRSAWDFVSIREYAAITRRTMREVRHLIDKGAVETVRIGGRVFVTGERRLIASDTQDR